MHFDLFKFCKFIGVYPVYRFILTSENCNVHNVVVLFFLLVSKAYLP